MTRKSWLKPPHSDTSRPGSVKATTLADVAKPDKPARLLACRICMEPASMAETRPGHLVSSLDRNGVCRDRQACEKRQPPLIPLEEL